MTRYFADMHTLADLKAEYKRLVKIHHPDVGGDTATMQDINSQYADALKRIAAHGETEHEREQAARETPEEFTAILSQIITLQGIDIEIVGAWLWITGNTFTHKDTLKAAGCRWASKKRAWYWRPEEAAVTHGGKKTLDEIRQKYGSARVVGVPRMAPRLAHA